MNNKINLKEFNYDFTRISFNIFSVKSGFSGCRAGDEIFAVACNGDIYKCQTLIGKSVRIGTVNKNTIVKRLKQQLDGV